MTRAHFLAQTSAIVNAKAAIYRAHRCDPTRPPTTSSKASMRCLKCGGLLTYSLSSIDGKTSGHCSSAGCIRWADL